MIRLGPGRGGFSNLKLCSLSSMAVSCLIRTVTRAVRVPVDLIFGGFFAGRCATSPWLMCTLPVRNNAYSTMVILAQHYPPPPGHRQSRSGSGRSQSESHSASGCGSHQASRQAGCLYFEQQSSQAPSLVLAE